MANNIHELAQEAFDNGNYQLALELFGHLLHYSDKYAPSIKSLISIDTYIGYGDALARCGHIRESFNVFAFIGSKLGCSIPVHKLKHLTIGLLESVTTSASTAEVHQRQLTDTQQLLLPPQKHLLHKQQQQQTLPLAPHTLQSDSSECAKFVLHECSQQRTKHSIPYALNKNYNDNAMQGDSEINVNRTQFVYDHASTMEYDKCDCKNADRLSACIEMTNQIDCSNDKRWNGGGGGELKHGNYCHCSECSVFLDNRCNIKTISNAIANETDPLLCPICAHVLLYPVTMNCGHTFCRDCVHNETQCQDCDKRFLVYGDALKQDVLITRLVEKWWMPHIQAESVNEKTQTLLRQNVLDEALKSCNEALEKYFT